MPGYPLLGVLALFPAAALWTSWPKRRWAAWASAGAGLAYWLIGLVVVSGGMRPLWAGGGLISIGLCLYASYVVNRNADEYDRLDEELSTREARRESLARGVNRAKTRIRSIETEQREVLALYSMIKGLSEALSWEDVRPKLITAVRQYLGVDEFALYVVEVLAQDRLRPLVRRKLDSSPGGSWETLQRFLQAHKLPFRVPHIVEAPEKAVAMPIFEGEKFAGYFYARIPKDGDPADLLAKAQTFIDEITFAFRRVRLFQEVEQSSQIDGLTGVFRRSVLDRKLEEERIRARTFKTSFCMMLLDIDHFKSLNDKYGHQFGDQVLRRIGEILRDSVYETDFVGRYGGEEFSILLPRAETVGVLRKGEALRGAIEAEVFELGMQTIRVTVSIGVAHFPRDGDSVEAIVRSADQALYWAKENGRNQVVDIVKVREQP